ncbi:MAG: T9SS type A sorting domain-containing protein, partial [Fibrobacter sp.]|nr:T9SS type A sorting domain-containing protein [Fibrobacter sp.]
RMSVSGNTLEITAPFVGEKTVRLFDLQGNLLREYSFAGNAFAMGLWGLPRGTYIASVGVSNRLLKSVRVVTR